MSSQPHPPHRAAQHVPIRCILRNCPLDWFVVCLMVFNATFNNISVISWRSVLFSPSPPVSSTDLSQVTDKFYHIMLYTSPWSRFELTTSVVIGIVCIGSCKSNYHTGTATAPPPPLSIGNMQVKKVVTPVVPFLTHFCMSFVYNWICSVLE